LRCMASSIMESRVSLPERTQFNRNLVSNPVFAGL
jgi:hypothetical protein